MTSTPVDPPSADALKRGMLLTIFTVSWVGTVAAWSLMETAGTSSAVLRAIFALNVVFHPAAAVVVWRRLLPLATVELSCLCFASTVCAACMALRLYAPVYGASIDLQPLYLWVPVIYVFAFTLPDRRVSLQVSLANLAVFAVISAPYVATHLADPVSNFTIQLHMVSAVLIAGLYFFSSYAQRFQVAQLTVDQLALLANTDALTQVPNRRRMLEVIAAELTRYVRYGHAFSVIVFDVDHFKAVNDRFGHSGGDQALVALAARTREAVRAADTLGRWGGEEFIVVLPETGFDEARRKAAALCTQVAAAPLHGTYALTVSCGVTTVAAGDNADALLQRADQALYMAKRQGRNRAEGVLATPAPASSLP